jgi:pyrroline-5-carboxylate reductase
MIGIIGAGNMGKAIASRIKQKIYISDIDVSAAARFSSLNDKRVLTASDNIELVKKSKVVILAVKPVHVPAVLKEVTPFIKNKLIVSIAAGVSTDMIEKISGKIKAVRVMPNMPALAGKGISAVAGGRFADKKDIAAVLKIFSNLGEVIEIEESLMDAVTALSGSGPAYYFLFTGILEKAGKEIGLSENTAKKLAKATFIGAAESVKNTDISMTDFVKKVASKGGTTEAALKVFKQKGLENTVKEAVKEARNRSREIAKSVSRGV